MNAHQWLEETLLPDGRPQFSTQRAIELVKAEPAAFQAEILTACVERLPELRQSWSDQVAYAVGEQLYGIASELYASKLPLTEANLCTLLRGSKHDCGHGCDVQAPLDLAMAYLAEHDASQELLSAIGDFCEALKGVGSIQAQTIKRKAAILLLLDRSGKLGKRTKNAWSHVFTKSLASMSAKERTAWQSLVLSFKLNERVELPKTFRKTADGFITSVGGEQMLSRIEAWWPAPRELCKLDTGGSHLLKHLVWLLEIIRSEENEARCDQLVGALAEVEWKPLQPAAKVVCAAAKYLAALPKSIAWEPLEKLQDMAPSREQWIREVVANYADAVGG